MGNADEVVAGNSIGDVVAKGVGSKTDVALSMPVATSSTSDWAAPGKRPRFTVKAANTTTTPAAASAERFTIRRRRPLFHAS
jgi:hypothetical protein